MSYYEVPDHCQNCGWEINTGGWRDTGLCSYCWRIERYAMKADEQEHGGREDIYPDDSAEDRWYNS